MSKSKLVINEKSIKTELKSYENKPYNCLFEYIWNAFDAGATEVKINFILPLEGIGNVTNLEIIDNGKGWNFDDNDITNNFMSSTKTGIKNKTLPRGKYGRGRYTFIWIANKIDVFSNGKKLTLQHNTDIEKDNSSIDFKGTKIEFIGITESLTKILLDVDNLHKEIISNFGWFLFQNKNYKILINEEEVDITQNIKNSITFNKNYFSEEVQKELNDQFEVRIVLWEGKPSEYSKYYFLNENNVEKFKQNTELNKKSDNFWHSVYIKSVLFQSFEDIDESNEKEKKLDFSDKRTERTRKHIIQRIKEELIKLRKPYLVEQSDDLLKDLKEDNLLPKLSDFGIYDENSFEDLLKTVYTITPSLFVGKSQSEKKFICTTFAGLLSNQDDNLIKIILEQLSELTEEETKDLSDILHRTTFSNMIKTIKEVDYRLEVLDKLKILISEYKKETLEVKHIQKVLDQNFWIFGEQFRLFSSTEGALKNVLVKYAKEILQIEDPELETQPNGEVDLFLTKTEFSGETIQRNIVVEIKRASIKLKRDKEFRQIEQYKDSIINQSIANGGNQYWEFYLIGIDYDEGIIGYINNSSNHGEKEKGLAFWDKDGKVKIYVRKWSDILEVEWGTKMKFLKEKLQIKAKTSESNNVDEIKQEIVTKSYI